MMKSVSALVLICVFACASAQFGVKGGSSDGSNGPSYGAFFPRFSPTQGSKGKLRPSNVNYGPSVYVNGGVDSTGRLSDQIDVFAPIQTRTVQPGNRFLYDNRQPTQQFVQFGANRVNPSYPSYARNIAYQPKVTSIQRVPAYDSAGAISPVSGQIFTDNRISNGFSNDLNSGTFGPVTSGRQFVPSTVVSRPAPISNLPSYSFYPSTSNRFSVPSFSSRSLPVSTFQPVTSSAVAPVSGQIFTDNKISSDFEDDFNSGAFGQTTVGKVGRQLVTPAVVSQPAPLLNFPSVSSGFTSVRAGPSSITSVPSVSNPRLSVQSFSPADVPVSSFPSTTPTVSPVSGQILSDNKISSPGFSRVQSQSPFSVISQEKQFADIVQTTEW